MNENPVPQPDQDEEGPWYLRNPFFEQEAARVKALPLPEHEPELLTIIERLASTVDRLQQENAALLAKEPPNAHTLLIWCLRYGSTEDLDFIYDKLQRRCPLGKQQAAALEKLQHEKQAADTFRQLVYQLAREMDQANQPDEVHLFSVELQLLFKPDTDLEATRFHAEKKQAVQDALADVLRQIRQPLRDKPTALDLLNRTAFMVVNDERNATNEACNAMAKRYGIDLGPVPEVSTEF